MNSKERVYNAFKLKEIDRIPVIPQLTYAAALWINKTIDECVNNSEYQYEALYNAIKECEYDGIYAGWEGSFNLLASAMGSELKLSKDTPPSIKTPLVSNLEDLQQVIKNNKLNEEIKFVNNKGIDTNMKLIKKLKQNLSDIPILSYMPGPFTFVGVLTGLNKLMINIIRNPEFIINAMELVYEFILYFGQLKIESGVDCLTIADPSSSSTMISPVNFEKFGFKYLKKLINDLRKVGNGKIKVGLHICGNTTPILNLIKDLKPDYFEVDSNVDLLEARAKLDDICIIR